MTENYIIKGSSLLSAQDYIAGVELNEKGKRLFRL